MTDDIETQKFLAELEYLAANDDGREIPLPAGVTMRAADLGGPAEDIRKLIELGWVYREFGWQPDHEWYKRGQKLGGLNMKVLATTQRMSHQFGKYERRGQMLISPEGVRRLKAGMN